MKTKAIELVGSYGFAQWICGNQEDYFAVYNNGDYGIVSGRRRGCLMAWVKCYYISQEYIDAQLKPFAEEIKGLDLDLTLPESIEYATNRGGFVDLFQTFKWLLTDSLELEDLDLDFTLPEAIEYATNRAV